MRMSDIREQAAVLAISRRTTMGEERTGLTMPETVALLRTVGSAVALLHGEIPESGDGIDGRQVNAIRRTVTDSDIEWGVHLIESLKPGVHLATLFDDEYPANLHDIHDQPPSLFIYGTIEQRDHRAVAVVGTRKASSEGLDLAGRLAAELADAGVTIVSGLAAGVDAAAHRGALTTSQGRTIAVFGTGINRVYPSENRELAMDVSSRGAVVSQFWPDTPPSRVTFPMRNVITSGMSLGTVVVEAKGKSGAAQQARHALKHGRRLFLVERLVTGEDWARKMATKPGVTVVRGVTDVLDMIEQLLSPEPASTEQELTLV